MFRKCKAKDIAIEHAKNLKERQERMKRRIIRKYHVDNLEWIETCCEQQLDKIEDLLDEDFSYEEIMRSVLWH